MQDKTNLRPDSIPYHEAMIAVCEKLLNDAEHDKFIMPRKEMEEITKDWWGSISCALCEEGASVMDPVLALELQMYNYAPVRRMAEFSKYRLKALREIRNSNALQAKYNLRQIVYGGYGLAVSIIALIVSVAALVKSFI